MGFENTICSKIIAYNIMLISTIALEYSRGEIIKTVSC